MLMIPHDSQMSTDILAEQAPDLNKDIDPQQVRKLPSFGGKPELDYVSAQAAFANANRIFGYGGWTYQAGTVVEVARQTIRWKDRNGNQKERTAILFECPVTVTVRGIPRTDIGQCVAPTDSIDNIEMARKGAVSDGVKRSLRAFGAQFGMSLYEDPNETAARRRAQIEGSGEHAEPAPPPRQETPRQPARQPAREEQPAPRNAEQQAPPAAPPPAADKESPTAPITEHNLDELVQAYNAYIQEGYNVADLTEWMGRLGNRPYGGGSWSDIMQSRFAQLTNGQGKVVLKRIQEFTPF